MQRIRADFKYDTKATVVSTPISEAFEKRRGVCQDFAHIMIAGLRGIGLPAAYISGYIRTIPPPGKKRLEGADAMHAWVSVWCGEAHGWVGLDPTNSMMIGNDHIVLAKGRDYADISPVAGIILGSREQDVDVRSMSCRGCDISSDLIAGRSIKIGNARQHEPGGSPCSTARLSTLRLDWSSLSLP